MSDVRVGIFPPAAGGLGDGWLAIWVSPQRFSAAVAQVGEVAVAADRDPSKFEHAMNVWCGFGATREEGRAVLAAGMENFYPIPFESFEPYSPYGTPEDENEAAAVGELRRLLRTVD